jgi:hypothetical protein
MNCIFNARTSRYLPKTLASTTENYDTDHYHYDHSTNSLDCKLLTKNPYRSYFQEMYPPVLPDLPDFPEKFRIFSFFPDFFRVPDFSGF